MACHAFLDPDDLVSGGATGGAGAPDSTTSIDAPVIEDDGGTAIFDATDEPPEWKGQVPPCAPAAPAGATLLAVVGGLPGSVPACPVGYTQTSVTGFGGVIGAAFACTKGTCGCGTYTGAPNDCVGRSLRYSSDPACTTNLGTDDLTGPGCTVVGQNGATHAMQVATVKTDTQGCPRTGQPTMVKQSTARFGLEVHGCQAAGSPGACTGGDVALPPTKDAVLCYQTSQSCANGYTDSHNFSPDQALNDTRKCDCRCIQDGGTCAGGTVRHYPQGSFCFVGGTLVPATCRPVGDFGFLVDEADPPTPVPGSATCTVGDPTRSGNVTAAANNVRLCCLTKCEACRHASTAIDQPCASQLQACLSDPNCAAFRACAIARSCTGSSCNGCNDAGVPDATPPPPGNAKYSALKSCQTNACAGECPD